MLRFVSLLTGLIVGLTPLAAVEPAPEAKRAIEQVIAAQVVAWNAGDLEGFMRGYLKSDDILFLSGADVTRGWDAMLAHYRKGYPDKATMGVLMLDGFEFLALSPESVLLVGHWKVLNTKGEFKGVTSLIFRQTKEGWRIVHDHTS